MTSTVPTESDLSEVSMPKLKRYKEQAFQRAEINKNLYLTAFLGLDLKKLEYEHRHKPKKLKRVATAGDVIFLLAESSFSGKQYPNRLFALVNDIVVYQSNYAVYYKEGMRIACQHLIARIPEVRWNAKVKKAGLPATDIKSFSLAMLSVKYLLKRYDALMCDSQLSPGGLALWEKKILPYAKSKGLPVYVFNQDRLRGLPEFVPVPDLATYPVKVEGPVKRGGGNRFIVTNKKMAAAIEKGKGNLKGPLKEKNNA